MTKAEFEQAIRDVCLRGNTLDAIIPVQIQNAINFIERRYSFRAMHKYTEVYLTLAKVGLPSRFKSIQFFRIWKADDWQYLTLSEPMTRSCVDIPDRFWIRNDRELQIWPEPDKAYEGEILYMAYTEWADGHWLLDRAQDVLFARTMLNMLPILRDDNQMVAHHWQAQFSDGLQLLVESEVEGEHSGDLELVMGDPQ